MKTDKNPKSILNVENLEPAINVCNEWDQFFVKNPKKAENIFKYVSI